MTLCAFARGGGGQGGGRVGVHLCRAHEVHACHACTCACTCRHGASRRSQPSAPKWQALQPAARAAVATARVWSNSSCICFCARPRGRVMSGAEERIACGGHGLLSLRLRIFTRMSRREAALSLWAPARIPLSPPSLPRAARAAARVDADLEPHFAPLGADVDKEGVEASDLARSGR